MIWVKNFPRILKVNIRYRKTSESFAITVLTIAAVYYFNVPNPAIVLMLSVIFSTFLGGFLGGILSGFLAILYCSYILSIQGRYLSYTYKNLYMIVTLIAFSTAIFMTGTLKVWVGKRNRELKELELANKQLRLLSTLDGLTGIANRRHFEQSLTQEWKRCLRDKISLSLAIIDVDFFKKYNDTYGHQAGDECLRKVSDTIASRIRRPGDSLARYGGEEFVILLYNTEIMGAFMVCEDIRQQIENLKISNGTSNVNPYVTVSIGIASVIPSESTNTYDFVKKADIALYNAKRNGRNQVQIMVPW